MWVEGLKKMMVKNIVKNNQKLLNSLHHQKSFFCVCMYKMANIDKETYKNSNIEAIVDGIGKLWLNEKHIEEMLGLKTLPVIISKYDQVYKKHRYKLVNKPKKQPNRRFLRSDLAFKVIMNCRADESCNLKKNLEFTLHGVINTKEQTVLESIKDAFEGEDTQSQIQCFRLQNRSLLS